MFNHKRLDKIQSTLDELKEIITTQELEKLRKDRDELHRLQSLLSNIKFKVKDINYFEEEHIFQIRYELPLINLNLDENGEIMDKNEFFYSTNMLDLISVDDMKKIQEELAKTKNKIVS